MSEEPPPMDDFQEEDPAADFLAREQDQLAQLEQDDVGFSEVTASDQDFGFQQTVDNGNQGYDPFAGASSEFVMVEGQQTENIPGLDDLDERLKLEDQVPADTYSSVRSMDTHRTEPEKIRKWREAQKARLEKKDAEEAQKIMEWREIAKKELSDWHRHRDEQLGKTQKNNREGEAAFVKDRDETVPGHEWEKICRLCEFNPKTSRNQKDVSRMRGILLQLKQKPMEKK